MNIRISYWCIFLLAGLFLACTGTTKKKIEPEEEVTIKDTVKPVKLLYGFPEDSFSVDRFRIPQSATLSDILNDYNLGSSSVFKIAQASDSVFPVRKMRAGKEMLFFKSTDSLAELKHFVYIASPLAYISYSLGDSISVVEKHLPVTVKEKRAKGVIESSLWNAMVAAEVSPIVALDLSDVYAWSIDFFGLQKGDSFKVVYDERYVNDTTSVGLKEIKYAVFSHAGSDFYAFPFTQDSVESFYDEKGLSLRKAFLKAPLKYSRISSGFSNSRLHPVLKIYRPHHGVDYAAPTGTPVLTIGDGVVIKKGYSAGAGHMVKIKHNSIYTSAYLHLSKYGKDIKVGSTVKQGQVIGYVGSTGLSTGPHLDFRVYKGGGAINPLKMESPPVEPVYDSLMGDYTKLKDSLMTILEKI